MFQVCPGRDRGTGTEEREPGPHDPSCHLVHPVLLQDTHSLHQRPQQHLFRQSKLFDPLFLHTAQDPTVCMHAFILISSLKTSVFVVRC